MEGLWATWLRPRVLKFEAERRAAAPRRLALFIRLGGVFAAIMFGLALLRGDLTNARDVFQYASSLITILGFVLLAMFLASAPPRRVALKRLIGNAAADAWGLSYDPVAPMPTDAYGRSTLEVLQRALFLPVDGRVSHEDVIYGRRYGVGFNLTEASITIKRGRRTDLVFQGILVRVNWRALHETPVLFAPTVSGERLGLALEEDWTRIATVSAPLDQTISFYAQEQVLGRAAIPPDRLEGLANLAAEHGFKSPRGVIMDGSLYLALETGNRFEVGRIWKTLDDPIYFARMLDDMMFVCKLVQAIAVPPSRLEETALDQEMT
ncbi:MAG: DUF3137 domain-containing protein [Pseudomonadota bacterium]